MASPTRAARIAAVTCPPVYSGWETPNCASTVAAVAMDGIQLKAKARVTVRTNLDRFWEAFSDDGRYWREVRPSTIDASSSPGFVLRLASGRKVLAGMLFLLPGIVSDAMALVLLALRFNLGRDLAPDAAASTSPGVKTNPLQNFLWKCS